MIYKVLYQKDQIQNPRRETTETLYTQSDSAIKVREILEAKTDFNVESIVELSGNYFVC